MPTKEEIFKYIMTNKTNPAVIESMLENIDGEIPYSQLYIDNQTNKALPLKCTAGAILEENNWACSEIPITAAMKFYGKALVGDKGTISYFISRTSDDLSITCNNENFSYMDKEGDDSGYTYSLNAIPSQINIQINNNNDNNGSGIK